MSISESMLNIESPKIFIGKVKDAGNGYFFAIFVQEKSIFGQKLENS